jgi:esterase/lipase
MREIQVKFRNGKNKLIGVLHLPDKKTKSAIVYSNGYYDNIVEHHIVINTGRELSKRGFAVFTFNVRGRWPSYGLFTNTGLLDEISDLEVAINLMKKKGYSKIGAIGHSLGGLDLILADKKNLKAIALWEPSVNKVFGNKKTLKEIVKKQVYVNKKYGYIVSKKMASDILKVYDLPNKKLRESNCPTLFVAGSKSYLTPHVKKYYKIAKEPKSLKIIENASHTFYLQEHEKKLLAYTAAWFKKYC